MITDSLQVPESTVVPYTFSRKNGILGMMDCGGSNLVKINEQFKELTKEGIVRIVATSRINHPDVKAREKAKMFGVPLVELDFRQEEEKFGVYACDYFRALDPDMHPKIKSALSPEEIIQVRTDICSRFLDMIYGTMDKEGIPRDIPVFAAGFMSLLSKEFINRFFILNVHPGDLTKYSLEDKLRGKRTIVGDAWIPPARAISAGHENLYSSMHVMVPEMDAGPVLMRGYPLPIDYNRLMSRVNIRDEAALKKVGAAAQEALKHLGDHVIAGASFLDVFDRRWGRYEIKDGESKREMLAYRTGALWYLAPNGINIEDHVTYRNGSTPFKRTKEVIDEKVKEFYKAVEEIGKQK